MNPIEQTPQNNHDGRPKRRRLDVPTPGDTPALSRYVSAFNRSPIDAPSCAQLAENRPSGGDAMIASLSIFSPQIRRSFHRHHQFPSAGVAAIRTAGIAAIPMSLRWRTHCLQHHEPIHYLAFHDDDSLVLLHCAADGY
jgi:hypothetical protein